MENNYCQHIDNSMTLWWRECRMAHTSGWFQTVSYFVIFCSGRVRTVRGEISLAKWALKQILFTLFWHQQINCPSWAPGCSDWMCKEPWISKYDAHQRCKRHLENEDRLRNMQNMVRLHTEMGKKMDLFC